MENKEMTRKNQDEICKCGHLKSQHEGINQLKSLYDLPICKQFTPKNQNDSPHSNAEVINQKVVPSKDKNADTQNLSKKVIKGLTKSLEDVKEGRYITLMNLETSQNLSDKMVNVLNHVSHFYWEEDVKLHISNFLKKLKEEVEYSVMDTEEDLTAYERGEDNLARELLDFFNRAAKEEFGELANG